MSRLPTRLGDEREQAAGSRSASSAQARRRDCASPNYFGNLQPDPKGPTLTA